MGYFEMSLFAGIVLLPVLRYFHVISNKVFVSAMFSYLLCFFVVMVSDNALLSLFCGGVCFLLMLCATMFVSVQKLTESKCKRAVCICDFTENGGKILMDNVIYNAVGEGNSTFFCGQIVNVKQACNDVFTVVPLKKTRF